MVWIWGLTGFWALGRKPDLGFGVVWRTRVVGVRTSRGTLDIPKP